MNEYMLMGTIIGLVVGVFIVIIILKLTKKDGKLKCEYDERQDAVRGKGYRLSFSVLAIYNFLYGFYGILIEKPFLDPFVAMMFGICLSVAVHVSYCIWHDAYFSLNENPKKVLFAFAAIAIFNLLIGAIGIREGNMIRDGVITFRSVNLICGMMFIVIFIALLAKRIKSKIDLE